MPTFVKLFGPSPRLSGIQADMNLWLGRAQEARGGRADEQGIVVYEVRVTPFVDSPGPQGRDASARFIGVVTYNAAKPYEGGSDGS